MIVGISGEAPDIGVTWPRPIGPGSEIRTTCCSVVFFLATLFPYLTIIKLLSFRPSKCHYFDEECFPSFFYSQVSEGFFFILTLLILLRLTILEESSLLSIPIFVKAEFIRISADLSETQVLSQAYATFGSVVLICEVEEES
ncbi:hypothetical protein AVEN_234548-1 [Araneus ventricosus]|uniref:Uncharacterized protein n=1 Tax=Araneus ventricosus TaxID=182803 RepID=A0A4Y2A8V6_ARAVE|nr:hypothetical protein AVEN_234548-1 [Araneus ventricosus]